jgi:hypothetical protein
VIVKWDNRGEQTILHNDISVAAEEVRDLQSWTGHVDPLRRRLMLFLRHQWREPVQRAHDLADDAGGHLFI